jgi:hypothetical protein
MGLRRRPVARAGGRPLRLPVERYVRCPRGGLAALDRCEACELMQGMLLGERLEVLCAFGELFPALRLHHAGRKSDGGTQGAPPPIATGERRDEALALASPSARPNTTPRRGESLIFESDWPDD